MGKSKNKSRGPRLWDLVNPIIIFVIDLAKLVFFVLGLLLAVVVFTLSAYWMLGFSNLMFLGTGYLLMPLAESEGAVGGAAINVGNFLENKYNFIADIGSQLVQCMEIGGELWNRIVAFVLGLARRLLEEFDINMPQWEDFRGAGDTPSRTIPLYDFVARMADDEAEHGPKVGEAGYGESQQRIRGLEARARLLAIRIARTLNPRNERIGIPGIINFVCNIVRSVLKVVIDIIVNLIEFVLFVVDFVIDLIGVFFTNNNLSFAQVLVKIIIQQILKLLDPCNCFGGHGGFPGNFPRSIFKCICFWEYKKDSDVPSNIINAIFGCPCPGFDITGINSVQEAYDQVIKPCLRLDFLDILIQIIQTGIDIVLTIIDFIIQIKNYIQQAINWLVNLINDFFDLFKKKREFACNGGTHWCVVQSERISDLEYDLHFKMYNNATGTLVEERSARMPFRESFRHVMEDPLVSGDLGVPEARMLFSEIMGLHDLEKEVRTKNFMFYDNLYQHLRATENFTYSDNLEDHRAWNEEITRGLPSIPCPLPIDPTPGARFIGDLQKKREQTSKESMERARAHILGVDIWAERTSMIKNYFLSNLAQRMKHSVLKSVLDIHGETLREDPDTMPEEIELLPVVRMGRDILRHFFEALASEKALTTEEVYQRMRTVPIREGFDALDRSARNIRAYHGWAADTEVKADMFTSAISNPVELPKVVRRHGVSPENVRSLEESLNMIETRVEGLEEARAHLDVGDREAAVRVVQNRILGDRAQKFFRSNVEPPRPGALRVAGVGIGIVVGAGGAIAVSAGFIIGVAVVLAPILPLLIILLAVIGVALLGVLIELAVTGIETLFDGGDPAGVDPVASLIYLIGPTVLDLYDVDQPTVSDFTNLFIDVLELQLDNLEALVILVLRSALTFAFPFVKPPTPNFDPATGAPTEGVVDYLYNRIQCENNVPCTIGAGEKFADSLGECGCFFFDGGDLYSRRGTYDEPCSAAAGEIGATVCYPFYRPGRFIGEINVVPGSPPECENFGIDKGPTLFATEDSNMALISTWWTNWKAVTIIVLGALAAGQAIPIVGIGAYPIQSFCPCFAPFAGPIFKLTVYTQVLSIFYPTVADWMLHFSAANSDLPLLGSFFGSLVPFFQPQPIDFDRGYCMFFYGGAWFWMSGWLLSLVPIIAAAGPLGLWFGAWLLWRVLLFPINYFIYLVLFFWYIARRNAEEIEAQNAPKRKELRDVTVLGDIPSRAWNDPILSEKTPDELVSRFFD